MTLTFENTSRRVTANGLDMHYHEAGDGAPLVLIHGGGPGASGWSNYHRNINFLAQKFRVIVPDLPCHGDSEKLKLKQPRIGFFAESVLGLMDALDIDKADFVGNSLGGATSMMIARNAPERANRLALMGPATSLSLMSPFPSEGLKHMMGYYRAPGPSLAKMRAFIEIMVFNPSEITDELVQARYDASTRPDILENLLGPPSPESPFEAIWPFAGDIEHETLLIWGREDRVIPVDSAFFLFSQMRNARLHVFPNCGHWAQWEKTDEFNRLVRDFMAS